MAERNPIPATAATVEWNTNPTNPATDPALQRAAGWAVNEIPDAQEFNFLQTMWGDFLVWLRSFAPREWSDVRGGLVGTSVAGDLFYVYPPTPMHARAAQLFSASTTATGAGVVNQPTTDGERIYYFGGTSNQYLVGAHPTDGTELWESQPLGANSIKSICSDGNNLYLNSTAGAKPGLRVIQNTDGVESASGGAEYNCLRLATNGAWVVGVAPNSGIGKVVFWTTLGGIPTEPGVYDTAGNMLAVAIDADQCYIGGVGGTYDVWGMTLATQTFAWRIALPVTGTPNVKGIATDGDFVYVATDRIALAAGGSANLFVLSRDDGTFRFDADIGATVDLDSGIAIDDGYLYASDGTTLYIMRLGTPFLGVVSTIANGLLPTCDGVSVTMVGSPVSTFKRHWMLGASKLMMRADGADPNRRPFHTLAVPAGGRA